MKIRETFEYEVDASNLNEVFKIKDYVDCVDDMPCPFWDGYPRIEITDFKLEVINND